MTEPVLLTEKIGTTALLTMNRPEARNALGAELVGALTEAFGRASADLATRAVVLTGKGEAFCGGADLKALASMRSAPIGDNLVDAALLKDLFRAVGTCPKPVVAAVNGPALAGGCGLASLCDGVLACPEARFGYPEVRVGFVAAMVLIFLARQIGERRAREILLSGRVMDAEAAVALGLADRLAPRDRLLEDALEWARKLSAGAPAAQALTKELLWRTSGLSLDAALDMASLANAFARTGPEVQEGVTAFLDKRRPSWGKP